jgi:dihydrofolate reductase
MTGDNQKELRMSQPLDLSLIVAMTPGRVIGRNTVLPWHLPSDLARFKEITTKIGAVVVGRTTYESILTRNGTILPERRHIVLTRNPLPVWADSPELVVPAASTKEVLAAVEKCGSRAVVIGGAQVYDQLLPFVQRIFLTTVYTSVNGDAFFTHPLKEDEWECTDTSGPFLRHARDDHKTSFDVYQRVTRL